MVVYVPMDLHNPKLRAAGLTIVNQSEKERKDLSRGDADNRRWEKD
ncbi:hypothetical protein Vi05172_g12247 [Venturia inaequalis]|nr:hypothetical protein Vi05172_g12247 [Venturia inaequalis]